MATENVRMETMARLALRVMNRLSQGHTGGTLGLNLSSPTNGYTVGGKSWSMVSHPSSLDVYTVSDYIAVHHVSLSCGSYLGWWTHEGRVWFDISDNVENFADAMALAKLRGEIAIWHVDNNEEIKV